MKEFSRWCIVKDRGFEYTLKQVFKMILNILRRYSIYKRLIVSFLLIIIIPNLIIGYYSFNISSREMDKNISSSSKRILDNIEQTIDEKLKFYEKISLSVYSNTQIKNLLAECKAYKESGKTDPESLEKYGNCKNQIGNILYEISPKQDISNLQIVTDYDQFIQIDHSGINRGAALKVVPAFIKSQDYLNATSAEGFPVWSDSSKEKGIFLVEPHEKSYLGGYISLLQSIPDPALNQNKQLGVIIINVPNNVFLNMVDLENMYDQNEIVFLCGKSGIVSIINGVYAINRLPDMKIVNEMIEKKEGSIIKEIYDKDYILVFHTSEKTGMVISYMAERKKILSGVYNVRGIIIEVTIICILCALLISYLVTSSISIPLNKLKRTIEKVGESNLELEYQDNQRDEIGVLGLKFNAMIYRIKNLLGNLIDSELSRKNEEISRKEAELDALQMQIKPHFMYNTLNLIRWNAIFAENGEGPISNMIAAFSNLLRFNTIKTNRLVEIREEIDHLYAYEKVIKFKKELNFEIKLDLDNKEIVNYKITKLTFQPIVENAIKYGISSLETEGEIKIRIYKALEDLQIEITDNGPGIPQNQLEIINDGLINGFAAGGSIGLRNVNERIRLHFGAKYGLKIASEEGKYTSVIIHIPCVLE